MTLNEFGPRPGSIPGDPLDLPMIIWITSGKMYSWCHWFGNSNLSFQNQLDQDLIKKPFVLLSNKPNYKEVSLPKNKIHSTAVAMANIILHIQTVTYLDLPCIFLE